MSSGQAQCPKCGRVHVTYRENEDGETEFQVHPPGMRAVPTREIPNGYEVRCPGCGQVDVFHLPLHGKRIEQIEPWEE